MKIMTFTRTYIMIIFMLLYDELLTLEVHSGLYTKSCKEMTFDTSSLSIWLDESQVSSWKDCISKCLHHSKCASITFNSQTVNDVNCMLYSDETVACLQDHSDTEITIKVGQLSAKSAVCQVSLTRESL